MEGDEEAEGEEEAGEELEAEAAAAEAEEEEEFAAVRCRSPLTFCSAVSALRKAVSAWSCRSPMSDSDTRAMPASGWLRHSLGFRQCPLPSQPLVPPPWCRSVGGTAADGALSLPL